MISTNALKTISFLIILFFSSTIISKNLSFEKKNKVENILIPEWKQINFRGVSFKVLLPYSSTVSLANTNQYTWFSNNKRISVTIDVGNVPNGKENLTINELIPNLYTFAQEINNGNKRAFSDFKIISKEFINLGNKKAVLVNQQSKMVSGKNVLFNVHSYFVTAAPHFFSVVISYDSNSDSDSKIAKQIASSFVFSGESINKTAQEEPSLQESKKWFVDKLTDKLIDHNEFYGDYAKTSITHHYTGVGIDNGNFILEYTAETVQPNGLTYSSGSETTLEKMKAIIPIKKITRNNFDNIRTFNGKCNFKISTENNAITILNIDTNKKTFCSMYAFSFDCSEEENLGSRLNKALMHIQELTPTKSTMKKETF
jgi:hypothetical protein